MVCIVIRGGLILIVHKLCIATVAVNSFALSVHLFSAFVIEFQIISHQTCEPKKKKKEADEILEKEK